MGEPSPTGDTVETAVAVVVVFVAEAEREIIFPGEIDQIKRLAGPEQLRDGSCVRADIVIHQEVVVAGDTLHVVIDEFDTPQSGKVRIV